MVSRSALALPLLVLVAACSSASGSDDADDGAAAVSSGPDLVFNGPKAPQGGNASPPVGTLSGKKSGDTVTISYAPQRVRGCDGGGWGQDTQLKFLDRSGKEIGQGADGSGFVGSGMVPRSKPALILSAQIPPGAAKVKVLTVNDGGSHKATDSADTPHTGDNKGSDGQCSDTIDGKGWLIDIGSASSGSGSSPLTPTPSSSGGAKTLVPGIYEAKDTRSQKAVMTVRRASAHSLRYEVALSNDGAADQVVKNMWGVDNGVGNGVFVTPTIPNNDCEIKITVDNGIAKLSQGDSTCASQGFGPQVIVDGTYQLTKSGAPPSDAVQWTGSFADPSGDPELDITVQTQPLPGKSAFSFTFAYQLASSGSPINGIAKVTDQNSPATATVSGCTLSFDWLLDHMTVNTTASQAACQQLGFTSTNAFEILPPKQ
jgi:hypothetical protein